MSAEPSTLPSEGPHPSALSAFAIWLVVGGAGVALAFAASVHVPRELKLVGLYGVGLGVLAGWGLGKWAVVRRMSRPALVAGLTWVMIAGGEVLAAVQTHRLGVKPVDSELKPEQLDRDMVTEGMRQYYAGEPDDLSAEARARWREGRDFFERGEKARQAALEARRLHRSFYGYLANRIDQEKWGKWSYPWPVVFWGGEVILGSTIGAWLALRTLRAASPRPAGDAPQMNHDHQSQGSRG